ncbi:hypothetical protein RFI_40019, partial [Reticulomyxa filosa]
MTYEDFYIVESLLLIIFFLLSTKVQAFFSSYIIKDYLKKKLKSYKNELKFINQKEKEIQIITRHWIRTLNIKLGWIKDFDKIIVNYVSSFAYTFFMFDTFRSSSKLNKTFTGHAGTVFSIDYSTFDDCQFICSGSYDKTVCVWDIDNNQIQSFDEHSSF